MRIENITASNLGPMGRSSIREVLGNILRKTYLFIAAFLLISSILFLDHFLVDTTYRKDISVADFRFDVNRLTVAASVLETLRQNHPTPGDTPYGSDGRAISLNEVRPGLAAALVKIADANQDRVISEEEIKTLKIMHLTPELYRKELQQLQFELISRDHNLRNYLVITQGQYSGTLLYNGPLRFVDSKNTRYFGIELKE